MSGRHHCHRPRRPPCNRRRSPSPRTREQRRRCRNEGIIEGTRNVRSRTNYFYRYDAFIPTHVFVAGRQILAVCMMAIMNMLWMQLYIVLACMKYSFERLTSLLHRNFAERIRTCMVVARLSALWCHQIGLFFLLDLMDFFLFLV